MPSNILPTCPVHGGLELPPAVVNLQVCSFNPELSYYEFPCASCSEKIRKPADDRIVTLLRSGGVVVNRWKIPAEAKESHIGPLIALDDLIDFGRVLYDNDIDLVEEARRAYV